MLLGRLGALGPGWVDLVPRLGAPAPGAGGLVSDWRDDAACLGDADPGDWFASPLGEAERVARAVAVCEECPVAMACLEFALAVDERWGVWGGFTPLERGHGRDKGLPETHARELAIMTERRRSRDAEKNWTRQKGVGPRRY